ncbi:MAG: hypothetical protein ACREFP_03125, partial [Acetobacteraceae bacterium]
RRAIGEPVVVGPTGAHGDPVFTHPIGLPHAAPGPTTINVNVHAPLTVEGSLLATEAQIDALIGGWWNAHGRLIGDTVAARIDQQQKHAHRRTLAGPAMAGSPQ